jgi:benzoyl-CoA reductase/2-hydroxyglutaryl-CoA dehydratase subunit BcrC/BadD/HgdB
MSPDDGLITALPQGTPTPSKPRTLAELEDQRAYVRQSRQDHSYSKAVGKLFDLLLTYGEYTEEAARQGRRVVWLQGVYFCPILYACDIIPRGVTELGRIGSLDAVPIADDLFQLPKEACSMIATVIGELYLKRDTLVKEVVVYTGVCEPINIGWELLKEHGYKINYVEGVFAPPPGDEERKRQVVQFVASEFGDVVQRLTGKPLDDARLSFELARSNRLSEKLGHILDLRIKNPYYLRSLATTLLIEGNSNYFGRPDEYEEVLDLLIEEMEASAIIPPPKGKVIPIAWIGHRGQEFGVYKAVDDAGGALHFNAPGVGRGKHWRDDIPPLEAVGEFLTGGWARGNWKDRFKTVENIVNRTEAKGIILYTYIGCTFGGFHNEIEREHFQKLGYPSLNLEGSFQVGAVHGQLLTRVRAFVEMLS